MSQGPALAIETPGDLGVNLTSYERHLRAANMSPKRPNSAVDPMRNMEARSARQQPTQWLLRDGAQDPTVDLMGLRPGEPGCGAVTDGNPSPTPPTEPPSLLNSNDESCRFLDREAANAILGPVTPGKSLGGSLIADSVMCTYDAAGQAEPKAIINVRRFPTPAGEAAALSREVFGEHGLAMTSSAGRAAWKNGCVSTDSSRTPAIAVSAEPWFVVTLVPRTGRPVEDALDTKRRLRALAAALDFPARPCDQPRAGRSLAVRSEDSCDASKREYYPNGSGRHVDGRPRRVLLGIAVPV